jgi:hypothetical protein
MLYRHYRTSTPCAERATTDGYNLGALWSPREVVPRLLIEKGDCGTSTAAYQQVPTTSLVALTVGFLGTFYHGYQEDPTVPTVEGALRDAIRALGVLPVGPLRKKKKTRELDAALRWSASSRTDARVHAAPRAASPRQKQQHQQHRNQQHQH